MNHKRNYFKDVLFGVAVGDALGVPFEFRSRGSIARNPATDMIGYGTYSLPPGTWSDDSSLTFCLAEALCGDFTLDAVGYYFRKWYYESYWTPYGNVFDIGITTRAAISRIESASKPEYAGDTHEQSNGNGSLMRILPLLFYLRGMTINERFEIVSKVSSITHGHIRSVMACFYYLEFANRLMLGVEKMQVYRELQKSLPAFFAENSVKEREIENFHRLFHGDISECAEDKVFGSGYVVHTLEASIWGVLTTDDYKTAVLKAVNLGEDTDTTAAVTGGLAGILYGWETIPENWRTQLARLNDIEDLAGRLRAKFDR